MTYFQIKFFKTLVLSRTERLTGFRKLRVQSPLGLATFFHGNIFYGHSFPSADSRRALVSFWQKDENKCWLIA